MIRFYQSGKFWLRLTVYSLALAILLLGGSRLALQLYFSEARIQAWADAALADSGRRLHFSPDIDRSLLPRPTVTLKQVRLSRPHDNQADLDMARMRIGLGWQSLLGQPLLEKWVWEDATLRLYPQGEGWNFDDLRRLATAENTNRLPLNRLQWRNMQLEITTAAGERHRLGLNAAIRHLHHNDSPFEAEGQWQPSGWPALNWRLQGAWQHATGQWRNGRLQLEGDWPPLGPSRSDWQFEGQWQRDTHSLLLPTVQWQWHSPARQWNLNGSGQRWQIGWERLQLPQASLLLHAGDQGNATLQIHRLQWQNHTAYLEDARLEGSWQLGQHQVLFHAGAGGQWLSDGRWRLHRLQLASHQSAPLTGLWEAELQGQAEGLGTDSAHLVLNGAFDRQSLQLEAGYTAGEPATLSGEVRLAELNLRPYWQHERTRPATILAAGSRWPQWWQQRLGALDSRWTIQLGRALTPLGDIDALTGQVHLNGQQLHIDDIHAGLYGGRLHGHLRYQAGDNRWQLYQQFDDVHIKPLLQDTLGFHNLDGRGQALFDLNGHGWFAADWAAGLNGEVALSLQNGSWRGIDIGRLLQGDEHTPAMLAFDAQNHTAFDQFEIRLPIRNGIGHSKHTRLSAAGFGIDGSGSLDFGRRQMDYAIWVHTHGSGRVLPLKISGSLTQPAFALDFGRLTRGLHTPEQKQQALRDTLKQPWRWLNPGNAASSP